MIFDIFNIILAATQIYKVLMLWIYRLPKLQLVLNARNEHSLPRRMDTSAPPNANYDILFSIFQPRPDQQKVRWDVRSAINSKEHTFA